jgi:hypothetical protein
MYLAPNSCRALARIHIQSHAFSIDFILDTAGEPGISEHGLKSETYMDLYLLICSDLQTSVQVLAGAAVQYQ